MRTSATGRADAGRSLRRSAEHGFTPLRRSAEHGFTLVELLIVLTIMGLLSAAVVVAIPDSRGSLRSEAEGFAAYARAAQDRAVMGGRSVALSIGADGYELRLRRGREWQHLESRKWGDDVTALSEGVVVFDPTGLAEPAEILLRREDAQASVAFSADGGIEISG